MPAKLSSVNTTNNHEKEKSEETQLLREALVLKAGSDPVTPGPFAVTPDGKYLLVAVGSSVRIVNTATDTISGRSIDLATPPAGIAVGTPTGKKSLECYIWLPQERRLHMTGLSGFLPE